MGEPGGNTVLPRRSFERWVEERRGYSEPWPSWPVRIAGSLATALDGVVLRQSRKVEELIGLLRDKERLLAQKEVLTREMTTGWRIPSRPSRPCSRCRPGLCPITYSAQLRSDWDERAGTRRDFPDQGGYKPGAGCLKAPVRVPGSLQRRSRGVSPLSRCKEPCPFRGRVEFSSPSDAIRKRG